MNDPTKTPFFLHCAVASPTCICCLGLSLCISLTWSVSSRLAPHPRPISSPSRTFMAALPKHEVKKKLTELRDAPVAIASDEVLKSLSTHLLGSLGRPPNPATFSPAYNHWFCSQADEVTREAAIFLIRLHAYNSNSVEVWRLHLKRVLSRCCYCVRGLHEAEIMSRHT